jgi:hypothetical protein
MLGASFDKRVIALSEAVKETASRYGERVTISRVSCGKSERFRTSDGRAGREANKNNCI